MKEVQAGPRFRCERLNKAARSALADEPPVALRRIEMCDFQNTHMPDHVETSPDQEARDAFQRVDRITNKLLSPLWWTGCVGTGAAILAFGEDSVKLVSKPSEADGDAGEV